MAKIGGHVLVAGDPGILVVEGECALWIRGRDRRRFSQFFAGLAGLAGFSLEPCLSHLFRVLDTNCAFSSMMSARQSGAT